MGEEGDKIEFESEELIGKWRSNLKAKFVFCKGRIFYAAEW